MDFNDYQQAALKTAIYPDRGQNFTYPALGLMGEAGEVADKLKKVLRDKGGVLSDTDKLNVSKEIGDVLWYVAVLCAELNADLNAVAEGNLAKLASRQERGVLSGSGDDR
jgi:NTP pyrophosphatase (non-canonical NTP hydrolase)